MSKKQSRMRKTIIGTRHEKAKYHFEQFDDAASAIIKKGLNSGSLQRPGKFFKREINKLGRALLDGGSETIRDTYEDLIAYREQFMTIRNGRAAFPA